MAPGLFLGSRSNLEVLLPLQPRLVGKGNPEPVGSFVGGSPIPGEGWIQSSVSCSATGVLVPCHAEELRMNMWMNMYILHMSCRCVTQKRWSNMQLCLRWSIHAYIFIVGTQHVHLTASSDLQSRKNKVITQIHKSGCCLIGIFILPKENLCSQGVSSTNHRYQRSWTALVIHPPGN